MKIALSKLKHHPLNEEIYVLSNIGDLIESIEDVVLLDVEMPVKGGILQHDLKPPYLTRAKQVRLGSCRCDDGQQLIPILWEITC